MKRLFLLSCVVLVATGAVAQEAYSPVRLWKGANVVYQSNITQLDSITYNIVTPPFAITVSDFTASSMAVPVSVTPSDTNIYYYVDVISQEKFESYESEAELVADYVSYLTLLTSFIESRDQRPRTVYDYLYKGSVQRYFANLSFSTSYYAIAFQLDSASLTLVGSITKTPLQTPVKSFDTLSFSTQLEDSVLWFIPNSNSVKYLALYADADSLSGFTIPQYYEAFWTYIEKDFCSFPPFMRNLLVMEGASEVSLNTLKAGHNYVFIARTYSAGFYNSDLYVMNFSISDSNVVQNSVVTQAFNLSPNQLQNGDTEGDSNSILLWNNGVSSEFQLHEVDSLTFRFSSTSPSQTYPDNLQFTSCYVGIMDTSMYGEILDTLRASDGQLYNVKLVQSIVFLFSDGFYLNNEGDFAGTPEGYVIEGCAPVYWAPSWANKINISTFFILGNWYINDVPSRPDRTIPTGKVNNNYLAYMHSYVNCLNIHDSTATASSLMNANQYGCEGALLYKYVYHTQTEGYPDDGYYGGEMPEMFVDGVMFEASSEQLHSAFMQSVSASLITAHALKNEVVDSTNVYHYGCSLHYDSVNGYTWNDEEIHWDPTLHMYYYNCCLDETNIVSTHITGEQNRAISNLGDIQTTRRIVSALSKSSGKREDKARSSSAINNTSILDSLQLVVALRSGDSITYAMNALKKITFTDTTIHFIDIQGTEMGATDLRDVKRIVFKQVTNEEKLTPPVCADTWFGLIYKVPGMFESEQFEDIHYILTSDTTIGEHTYRKLMQNDTICVGGLRQTEDGMKVYYYDMVSPSYYPFSHVDCLLYDFTANVGDTIKNVYFREEDIYTDAMYGVDFGGSVVLKKDTIDGRIHMKVGHCDIEGYGPYYVTTWIQGIGTRNVIWPDLYGLPGKGWINEVFTLCALHGDEELYTFSLPDYFRIENNCTEWHFTGLNDIPADNSRARKFLRNGQLLIETPLGTFNATGKLVE